MRTPTEFELQHFLGQVYDPVKAHAYYEKHKKLKGRQTGQAERTAVTRAKGAVTAPSGRTKKQIHQSARSRQRKELAAQIQGMEQRLNQLEALIKKRLHEDASANRKGKAKKERAAKNAQKPQTAAEKAKAARDAKKNRAKNQQSLKTKAKTTSANKASAKKGHKTGKHSISELKTLATKVKGQIAVAKQKLAAL